MQLTKKKKHLRISPTHNEYAAYNASGAGCLDTCKHRKRFDPTRVNAPKISGSLTSGTKEPFAMQSHYVMDGSLLTFLRIEPVECRSTAVTP